MDFKSNYLNVVSLLCFGFFFLSGCFIKAPPDPSSSSFINLLIFRCNSGADPGCTKNQSTVTEPDPVSPAKSICSETTLEVIQPSNWIRVQNELQLQASKGSLGAPVANTFGVETDASAYVGAVLTPAGRIIAVTNQGMKLVELDPVTRLITNTLGIGFLGFSKWNGGVLSPSGSIELIPSGTTAYASFDPVSFGAVAYGTTTGFNDFMGGVFAPNGKFYPIPASSLFFTEVDPVTRTHSTFGTALTANPFYAGGVLGPNGNIYAIPSQANQFVEVDPIAKTNTNFGSFFFGFFGKWSGGVLAPNGKIYVIPDAFSMFVEIDPVAKTLTPFGAAPGVSQAYSGGVLAPNGKIYGIPFDATEFVEIDPQTLTVTYFGTAPGGGAWSGGVLAPNGKIYGMPYNAGTFLEIDPRANGRICDPILQSAYFNKY
ncbi:hypothetical protein A0128_15260 [Leptospira tipperaryensis]|uniref:TIGR03118 family protein n=1 Tax=Leptospira tipperaryensis TaxID=2564040 RepID=A0A1D7UZT7_9LEPT|nr:hypothetical protein [Leptospira tipperaryensis]AOP35078.1 hypothetical protein A0128_15260 [Leptospira tipperaryensis]